MQLVKSRWGGGGAVWVLLQKNRCSYLWEDNHVKAETLGGGPVKMENWRDAPMSQRVPRAARASLEEARVDLPPGFRGSMACRHWCQTLCLENCEIIHFWCLSHWVCGTWLHQLKETNTGGQSAEHRLLWTLIIITITEQEVLENVNMS